MSLKPERPAFAAPPECRNAEARPAGVLGPQN